MRRLVTGGLVVALSALVVPLPVRAQQSKPGIKKDLSPREEQILGLFIATKKHFTGDGRVVIHYDFESMSGELVEDWSPKLKQTRSRIRWSRGLEGTQTTVEHGIIISDVGSWIHKARFLPDVEVTVDMLTVSPYRKGTILAPIYYLPKKKMSLGSNDGNHVICLKGTRLAKKPHPLVWKTITPATRRTIGFKYAGDVIEARFNKRKTVDSSKISKFTKGFDKSGHVGLAWNGSVQAFIFGFTVEGRLDPEWVAEQLGESKKGKKRRRR